MGEINIDTEVLQEFKQITSKDIYTFFRECMTFFNGGYNAIVSYYSGKSSTISSTPFAAFDKLKMERDTLFEVYNNNIRQFGNLKWFILLEKLEEIDNRLRTLDNINRWARSSLTKVAYSPSIQFGYTLKENQTLEGVAADVLNSNNPEDDWVDIAVSNNLTEEDYDKAGGTNLSLKIGRGNNVLKINSVVDTMIGKSIYGKDIDKDFVFENGDIRTLNYDKTLYQSVYILATLKKNSNPAYRNLGLQSNLIVGNNRAMLSFPIIIRQMNKTFATDDTLKNFSVKALIYDQDNLKLDFSVQTRLGEVIPVDLIPL